MAALVTLQKAGVHADLLKKNGLPIDNLEAPRLLVVK
jgi:polar amino acid transport system substrate-binding protein